MKKVLKKIIKYPNPWDGIYYGYWYQYINLKVDMCICRQHHKIPLKCQKISKDMDAWKIGGVAAFESSFQDFYPDLTYLASNKYLIYLTCHDIQIKLPPYS